MRCAERGHLTVTSGTLRVAASESSHICRVFAFYCERAALRLKSKASTILPCPELAIEINDVHKTYRDGWFGRTPVHALRGVTFQIPTGQIFGLLGPNGAGKTTLIKSLLGIIRISDGSAKLMGYPAGDLRGRRQVGYLPEGHRIPSHHNGNTALEFFGRLSGMTHSNIRTRREELLKTVGLEGWGKTPVRKYSKGMQQRLGLAQAMLHDPQVLILDEPTDGVDPVGRSEMREVLFQLRAAGKTIFINSHLLQEIELVCDKVAILHRGKLRREAAVGELTVGATSGARFVVAGEPEAIQSFAAKADAEVLAAAAPEQYEILAKFTDQSGLDQLIDELRSQGVSICSVTPTQRTLEEAFLDIIREQDATATQTVQDATLATIV